MEPETLFVFDSTGAAVVNGTPSTLTYDAEGQNTDTSIFSETSGAVTFTMPDGATTAEVEIVYRATLGSTASNDYEATAWIELQVSGGAYQEVQGSRAFCGKGS